MTRACHIAVRSAIGNVFSDQEIDDFLDRLAEKAKRAGKEDPTLDDRAALGKAAGELTREQLMADMLEKRVRLAADVAKAARIRRLEAMPANMSEAQRLSAYDVG